MDSLAQRYLGYHTIKYEDVAGKGAKQIGFSEVALDDATRYAAEDADITLRLHRVLQRSWRRAGVGLCTARSKCRWCRCWHGSKPTAS
jgi:DNA polymerase I-like protein with 3'-5' exonuclease and polymerase domains